jgi:dipeptidyl aminopeptidase/acylaminoacyl peptidase
MNRIAAVFALIVAGAAALLAQNAPSRRPMTPDDLFRMEDVGDVVFSPDGNWLAYVLKRAKSVTFHKWDYLDGNDRGDIWLVPAQGGAPRNLTDGAADGAGFWMPSWSPDGKRIAMLSTRGDDVHVFVWDRATGQLTRRTDATIEPWSVAPRLAWAGSADLLVPTLPKGKRSEQMTIETQTADEAMKQWAKNFKGAESTVSVLESGGASNFEKRPKGDLVAIGAADGTRVLASAAAFSEVRVSPDGTHFAALRQADVYRPEAAKSLPLMAANLSALVIGQTSSGGASQGASGIRDVVLRSLRWSPDGSALALIGYPAGADARAQVFRCRARDGVCLALAAEELDPTPPIYGNAGLVWSSRGSLLVQAKRRTPSKDEEGTTPDWWLVAEGAPPRKIASAARASSGMTKTVLSEIVPDPSANAVWGVSDGHLDWIPLDGSAPRNRTEGSDVKIGSIVWPTMDTRVRAPLRRLVVGVPKGASMDLFAFDVESGKLTPIVRPSEDADFKDCSPDGSLAAFEAATRDGTYLWISALPSGPARKILETNTFLSGVAEGVMKPLSYKSTEGQDLKGWILLPPGYPEGTKCPTVADVYAGYLYGDKPPYLARLNLSHALNHQLLAAHGYAVLFPSMPLTPEGTASDPYMELSKGVLPAVDKAIELGYADPKRLGVMGQSFGGFSTYGLVTQTDRFGAAIALAGLSDFISLYGVFDARVRYTDHAQENLFQMSLFESGQTRMGNPPWKDIGRYLRNSPLFYVDRVKTPLMIIQGDMDYVSMQQGEQFFTALYRQGKRAAFVRYWGEGHVLESPANIRDMWQRIYGWLDENLKKPDEKKEETKS